MEEREGGDAKLKCAELTGLAGNGTLPQQQQVVTSSTGTPPAPAIDMTTPLELYIVGGFEDKRGISERLSFQVPSPQTLKASL